MNGNIEQLNRNQDLNRRAVAYATNNPGVSVAEAVGIIAQQDAARARRVTRIRETDAAVAAQRKNRSGV